jgi:methylenetetrahydrofolate dehydrogenase (NADP+) / methenyltetrahydrofolate cyclohydrolase
MKVPCEKIASFIKKDIAASVKLLKKDKIKPKLVTILIGDSKEQQSYVAIKEKVAKEVGIQFEFIHLKKEPPFLVFANLLKEKSHDPATTGVIIQQPLPSRLQTDTIYNFIPPVKEIEGHHPRSPHMPPLGLAVLTVLKYIYQKNAITNHLFIDRETDANFFKTALKHKKVVVVGRGQTGGAPIGKTLSHFKINYLSLNQQTFEPEQYYKEADVIITAAGKKVITPEVLKQNVILINVGMHKVGVKLRGDYFEEEIDRIASYYTQTPKGTGPLDVLYLYKNLIDAARLSAK